jgi:hypothetical protein
VAVDPSPISAFQICEDNLSTLGLDFGVETTHPFIVEPKRITFFTTNRDGQFQTGIVYPPIDSLKNLKGRGDYIGFGLAHRLDYKLLWST